MPDWEKNSPRLTRNLTHLLRSIRDHVRDRGSLNSETIRQWHVAVMEGLDVPVSSKVGCFRGGDGLDLIGVRVGSRIGVPPKEVGSALAVFDDRLGGLLNLLDSQIPPDSELNADQLSAALEACAWAHAEWVRIHPFANGNGRTARLLANALAMRYGLPPFVRLRPRPNDGYAEAGRRAMAGDWESTVGCFTRMLARQVREQASLHKGANDS